VKGDLHDIGKNLVVMMVEGGGFDVVDLGIDVSPDKFVEAINKGQPILFSQPEESVSALIEDFAFLLSKERHKKTRPAQPTAGWKRVYKRFSQRRK